MGNKDQCRDHAKNYECLGQRKEGEFSHEGECKLMFDKFYLANQSAISMELHTTLLTFYGVFLILCGIVSVIFIGMKAKTALASGGISGAVSLLMAWLISQNINSGRMGGIILTGLLFIAFSWRATKTLFKIFELLQTSASAAELNGKGIAFLIISLMAVVSIVVLILQLLICTGGM